MAEHKVVIDPRTLELTKLANRCLWQAKLLTLAAQHIAAYRDMCREASWDDALAEEADEADAWLGELAGKEAPDAQDG